MRGKLRSTGGIGSACGSFNEARALCAGSCPRTPRSGRSSFRFNEARALCAGSFPEQLEKLREMNASMRPAHYAREVPLILRQSNPPGQASMRPAHYAREVQRRRHPRSPRRPASMRPAHYAREVKNQPGFLGDAELLQ